MQYETVNNNEPAVYWKTNEKGPYAYKTLSNFKFKEI